MLQIYDYKQIIKSQNVFIRQNLYGLFLFLLLYVDFLCVRERRTLMPEFVDLDDIKKQGVEILLNKNF
jgi:hypothetical protein